MPPLFERPCLCCLCLRVPVCAAFVCASLFVPPLFERPCLCRLCLSVPVCAAFVCASLFVLPLFARPCLCRLCLSVPVCAAVRMCSKQTRLPVTPGYRGSVAVSLSPLVTAALWPSPCHPWLPRDCGRVMAPRRSPSAAPVSLAIRSRCRDPHNVPTTAHRQLIKMPSRRTTHFGQRGLVQNYYISVGVFEIELKLGSILPR